MKNSLGTYYFFEKGKYVIAFFLLDHDKIKHSKNVKYGTENFVI